MGALRGRQLRWTRRGRLLATSHGVAGGAKLSAPPVNALFRVRCCRSLHAVAPLSPATITAQGASLTTFRLTLPSRRPTTGPNSRVPTTIKS